MAASSPPLSSASYNRVNPDDYDDDGVGMAPPLQEPIKKKRLIRDQLDRFLSRMYEYHRRQGYWPSFLSGLFKLLEFLFVIVFTAVLTCIDYAGVNAAVNNLENETVPIGSYIAISNAPRIVIVIVVPMVLYWVWEAYLFVKLVIGLREMRAFFNDELKITDSQLWTLTWEDVVGRVTDKSSPLTVKLTALSLTQRIMRLENYLIAIFSDEIVRPVFPGTQSVLFTTYFQWAFQSVFQLVLWKDGQVVPGVKNRNSRQALSASLAYYFKLYGVFFLMASPLALAYRVAYYFYKYMDEVRQGQSTVTKRNWSLLSKYKFREYNEVIHVTENRMNAGYRYALEYCEMFPRGAVSLVASFLTFIFGSFVGVLGVAALIDDSVLQVVTLFQGRSILFYIGVFTFLLSFSRSYSPRQNVAFYPEPHMEKIRSNIYFSKRWKHHAHEEAVYKEFLSYFPSGTTTLINELLSVVTTPLILLFTMPTQCDALVAYVDNHTVEHPDHGSMCVYSLLHLLDEGESAQVPASLNSSKLDKDRISKIELSFLHFKARHGNHWNSSEVRGADAFIDRMTLRAGLHRERQAFSPGDPAFAHALVPQGDRTPRAGPGFPLQSDSPSGAEGGAGGGGVGLGLTLAPSVGTAAGGGVGRLFPPVVDGGGPEGLAAIVSPTGLGGDFNALHESVMHRSQTISAIYFGDRPVSNSYDPYGDGRV